MAEHQRTHLQALGELARILDEVGEGVPLPEEQRLSALMDSIHAADLADLVNAAPEEARRPLFEAIGDEEEAAEVLASVDEAVRDDLLEHLPLERKVQLLQEMDNDDAADVLGELSGREQDEVLAQLDADDAAELRELVDHDPESAGGIMNNEFLAVHVDRTVRGALMQVKTLREDPEDDTTVYIVDGDGRLVGVIAFSGLLRARNPQSLREVMESEPVSARVDEDQEEVARRAAHYRLRSIPVVDGADVLVGVITADDLMEALGEEASEDMFRLAGTLEEDPTHEGLFERLWARFPFLLVTVIGTYFVALVIRAFFPDDEAGILRYIPMIAALAGNAGIQASTTMIRGFATGDIEPSDFRWILGREVSLGCLTGVAAAVVEFLIMLLTEPMQLCLVVPASQALSVVLATMFGTVIPFLCLRAVIRVRGREWRIDPALAAGPFITTLNDVVSTSIALVLFMPDQIFR